MTGQERREPREGESALVLVELHGCHGRKREWEFATWFSCLELSDEAEPDPDVDRYDEEQDQWICGSGWFVRTRNSHWSWSHERIEHEVIEWRELPEIPS